ncbi:hypothetical protein HY484_01700 [Candidatus Woesearchaeota archaeon]|nr:hypothetical protein [Candidatus Woesearchaeota archaeon]
MNKTHLLEFAGILAAFGAFILEFRRITPEESIALWALIVVLSVVFLIFISTTYLKEKIHQLDENTMSLKKLQEELFITKTLEKIHYRIGVLEGANHDKLRR